MGRTPRPPTRSSAAGRRADKARLYVSNSPRRDAGSAYAISQQGKLLSLDPDPYFSNADVPSKAIYQRLP